MKVGDSFQHQFHATDEVYEAFLAIFEDRNPMHTDKAFAQARGFKDIVLHGNILNGFLSYFIGECLPVKQVMIISQQIDFHRPFYKGDILSLDAKISTISSAVGSIEFKFVFRNQQKEKIAKGSIQIKELE